MLGTKFFISLHLKFLITSLFFKEKEVVQMFKKIKLREIPNT